MKQTLTAISFLIFFNCQTQTDNSLKTKNKELETRISTPFKKSYPEIDTSIIVLSDVYYQFVRISDSTATIRWGNKSFSNFFKDTIDNFFLEKGKTRLKWSNDKFIALGRGSGSDTWLNIILPLKKGADAKLYDNPLAVDKDNGIIVCEYYSEADTILLAENILTGKKQALGNGWKKCSSAFNHYCIDSINVFKKQLYIEWTLPNKIDEPNKVEVKRIKLNL